MSVGKVQLVSMDQLEAQGDAFYEAIRWRRCQVRAGLEPQPGRAV